MNMDVQSEWLTDDVSESFRNWVGAPNVIGASELFTLSEIMHHYCSLLRFKHLPNIHFFHFSDFKRDLVGQMKRMADILKIEIESELIARLAASADFDSMRNNASQYVPASGMQVWKSETQFFNRGDTYKLSELSDQDIELYSKTIVQSIDKDNIEWLESGYN